MALGPTRLPIQGTLWVKQLQRETDHSPAPRDEVTNTSAFPERLQTWFSIFNF